ncbi:hypothetical protein BBJ28_00002206 [Nothophytophthora sp. Chile5]|nr:hypothetical protein BBJ28_00002206 [Nothophytophthora sp. Chile5]
MATSRQKLSWQELQGPSTAGGAVRLLERRGSGSKLSVLPTPAAARSPSAKNSSSSNPKKRSPSSTPKSRQTGKTRGQQSPPLARRDSKKNSRPVSSPPSRPVIKDAQVLAQRLVTWEKLLKAKGQVALALAHAVFVTVDSNCPHCSHVCGVDLQGRPGQCRFHVHRLSPHRLWMSWYREIDGLQVQSRRSSSQTSAELETLLPSCSVFYAGLVRTLQSSLRKFDRSPECREGLKLSLQLALVALGDVARYSQNQLDKSDPRDWAAAREYYHQALQVAPSNGKVYNQLGLLAVLERKLLEGAYLYARSLVCESPFATCDNLLRTLQRGRSSGRQLQVPQQPLGAREAMEMYSTLVLSCQHVLLTGKDSEAGWDTDLEQMQAALANLLAICAEQDNEDDQATSLPEMLSAALIQVVCLAIVLVHNAQHTIGESAGRKDFDEAFVNWTGNVLTTKPLALGNVTLTCLLTKLVAVLSDSAESPATRRFANALLPAVNIYLEWLHLHPVLLYASNPSARAFQDDCTRLFYTLSARGFVERGLYVSSKRGGDLSGVALPEDWELLGFLPCKSSLQKRFSRELTRETKDKRSTPQLTEDELLVLRATRFMTLSESFVLPTCSVTASSHAPSTPSGPPRAANERAPSATDCHSDAFLTTGETVNVDPLAIDPTQSGRLCALCSNTSTFPDGECEFCGYEDDDYDEGTLSDDRDDAAGESLWIPSGETTSASPERFSASSRWLPHRRAASPPSSPPSSGVTSPTGELEADFTAIMAIGAQHAGFQGGLDADKERQRLIVIDAPNVAMRHGKGKTFSCAGVELAVQYFQALGHRVVAFMPDYMFQSDEERARRQEQGAVLTAAKIPDDVALLERLMHDGVLIPTPPQDYDDSYCIQYAGLHDGCVVTNDLFRDHVASMVGPRERKEAMRAWLRAHQISYSWVRNEFLPNPNFRCPAFQVSSHERQEGGLALFKRAGSPTEASTTPP